jgi:hypothetical protein
MFELFPHASPAVTSHSEFTAGVILGRVRRQIGLDRRRGSDRIAVCQNFEPREMG